MSILVLGATGFLGSNLFKKACENDGLKVFGASRFPSNKSNMIQVDVTNKQSIERAIQKVNPEVVVWCLKDMEEENRLSQLGLENLLSVIESDTKLIFLSTDAVFVDGKGGYKESDPIGTFPEDAPLAVYVNSKHTGESLIVNRHPNHVIIRTGPIYGDEEYIEQRTVQMFDKRNEIDRFEAWANVYRTFVNVNDLSNSILELSENKFNGILHVGPNHKESYYSFYKKRFKQLGWEDRFLSPSEILKEEFPYLSMDTSLNTEKAQQLLKTKFRAV